MSSSSRLGERGSRQPCVSAASDAERVSTDDKRAKVALAPVENLEKAR